MKLTQWRGRMDFEDKDVWDKWPKELAKLYFDNWPNIVLLANGKWFLTVNMSPPKKVGNSYYASFPLEHEFDHRDFVGLNLNLIQCLNSFNNVRDICVNLDHIVCVIECGS